MALTPTVLIATTGLMSGDGFGINTQQSSILASVTADPMVSAYSSLVPFTGNTPGLSSALSSMPSFITSASSSASSITDQAQNILPGAGTMMGNKNLIQSFSGAASFGSATAEYAAALNDLGGKSFADMGIGVKNFTGMLTSGVGGLIPTLAGGPAAVAAQASTILQNSVPGLPGISVPSAGADLMTSAAALTKLNPGQAAASLITGGLQSVGDSLKNFGTLFDFKNLSAFSNPATAPAALIGQLQKQGLADTYGINDNISAAGYDPKNLSVIPSSVLQDVLTKVSPGDLAKIQSATGASPVKSLTSALQLLHVESFLPPQAQSLLGIAQGGIAGLSKLGNTFTNLGVQIDNFKMGDFVGGIEAKAHQYLDQVTSLIPSSVSSALTPLLGSGGGPFGTPQMKDMLGSVAGAHTSGMTSVGNALKASASTSQGAAMQTAMTNLQAVLAVGGDPTAALAILNTTTAAFNAQVSANSNLSSVCTAANSGVAGVSTQIAKEASNLSLAGVTLPTGGTPAALGSSLTPFLSFGQNLHGMGVDTLKVGYSDFITGTSKPSLAGDALQASMVEGRNIAKASAVDKPVPSVSDTTAAITAAVPNPDISGLTWDPTSLSSLTNAHAICHSMVQEFTNWKASFNITGLVLDNVVSKGGPIPDADAQLAVDRGDQLRAVSARLTQDYKNYRA